MSRPVDERIVKMSMDDKDFRSKAIASGSILSKLADKLRGVKDMDLSKSTNSVNELNNKANSFDLSRMANALESINGRFSVLGSVAIGVLTNIATKAVDTGTQMLKALTLDPIISGFSEYEEKMNSIQVILSNTRGNNSLEEVNATLDQLNTYADRTIYSFADMTKNMGTFTAAGVDLKQSANSIQGIGNLAAISGSNTQQMSTAMYQLSQAMAAGKVNLQDWNSVVNAGMGGTLFQDTLKETAKEMGKVVDESVPFRESLQDGWLTTDVLVASLAKFNDESTDLGRNAIEAATKIRSFTQLIDTSKEALQSGWTETWETIIGDYQQSGDLWTEIGNQVTGAIDASSKARNAFVKDFVDLGGRIAVLEGLVNIVKSFVQVVGIGKHAFSEVFPPATAQQIVDIATKFRDFTRTFELNADQANILNNALRDVFSLADTGIRAITNLVKFAIDVFKQAGPAFKEVFPPETMNGIKEFANGIRELTERFKLGSDGANKVHAIFRGIFSLLSIGLTVITEVGKAFLDLFPEEFNSSFLDLAVKLADSVTGFDRALKSGEDFGNGLDIVVGIIKGAIDIVSDFAHALSDGVSTAFDYLKKGIDYIAPYLSDIMDKLKEFAGSFNMQDVINLGFVGALLLGVKQLKKLTGFIDDIIEGFSDTFGGIKDAIKNIGGLGDALETLQKGVKAGTIALIAGAVLSLAISMKIIASIDGRDIAKGLEVMAVSLGGIMGAMTLMGRIDITGTSTVKTIALLTSLSGAIMTISVALKLLSTIDPVAMATALGGLAGMLTVLTVALKALSKNSDNVAKGAGTMIGMATAITILAGAMKILASIDPEGLVKGVATIGILFGEITLFLKAAAKSNFGPSSAVGLVIISGAILVMVAAIKQIAEIDYAALAVGLGTIGLMLLALGGFTKLTSGADLMSTGVGLLLVATSIKMLVGPIKDLGSQDLPTLAKGLGTVVLALGAIVLAMKLATGGLAGAAAILVVSGAINALVKPLKTLGKMSIEELAKGLITLAAAFGIVAVAANVIGPVGSVALVAFAAAIGAVALAMTAIGLAFSAFVSTLTLLASLTVSGVATIARNLGLLLDELNNLVPKLIKVVVNIIVTLALEIAKNAPILARAGLEMILEFLKAIRDNVPQIADVALEFITAMINTFADNVGPLIEAGANLIVQTVQGMADALRNNGAELVSAVLSLVESILEVVVEALVQVTQVLFGWIPGVEEGSRQLGDAAINGLRERFNVDTAGAVGIEGGQGYADGVGSKKDAAGTAGKDLSGSAYSGAGEGDFTGLGGTKGDNFNSGLGSKATDSFGAGESLAKSGKEGTDSVDASDSGSNFASGFINGISSMQETARSAGESLGKAARGAVDAILEIFSPSRAMRRDGQYFGDGFVLGIKDRYSDVDKTAGNMGKTALDAMDGSINAINDVMNERMNMEPTITPVLDLTNIDALPDISNTLRLSGDYSSLSRDLSVAVDAGNNVEVNDTRLNTVIDKLDSIISVLDAIFRKSPNITMPNITLDGKVLATQLTDPITKNQVNNDRRYALVNGAGK